MVSPDLWEFVAFVGVLGRESPLVRVEDGEVMLVKLRGEGLEGVVGGTAEGSREWTSVAYSARARSLDYQRFRTDVTVPGKKWQR